MAKKRSKRRVPRFPEIVSGIDVNTCVTPACPNFRTSSTALAARQDRYKLTGVSAQFRAKHVGFQCRECRRIGTQYSNRAVVEEKERYGAELGSPPIGSCLNSQCKNEGIDVGRYPELYARFGRTSSGSTRFRCKACRKTFSVNRSVSHRLRHPEKTEFIFKLLVNKTAMRRLCEVADIGAETLYRRIDRIYDQCRKVARSNERKLLESGLDHEFLHLCSDRQEYTLNWGSSMDRTPPILRATTTAESRSGYIVAQHLNFDPDVDLQECELAARDCGDPDLPFPFRRFARLALHQWQERVDIANGPVPDGVQVNDTCSIFAHFLFLADLFKHIPRIQNSIDADPGMDRGCLIAFGDRILDNTADLVVLGINKDMTVSQRRTALSRANDALEKMRVKHPGKRKAQLIADTLANRYRKERRAQDNPFKRWVNHPFPNMNEPEKRVLCLSDTGDRNITDLGWVLGRANLMAVDRYFMQVRRRLSVLERPMSTSSQAWRRWRGYNAYSPLVVMKLLEIFRTTYNYHLVGGKKTTPAQRFGLSDKPWGLADILQFKER